MTHSLLIHCTTNTKNQTKFYCTVCNKLLRFPMMQFDKYCSSNLETQTQIVCITGTIYCRSWNIPKKYSLLPPHDRSNNISLTYSLFVTLSLVKSTLYSTIVNLKLLKTSLSNCIIGNLKLLKCTKQYHQRIIVNLKLLKISLSHK